MAADAADPASSREPPREEAGAGEMEVAELVRLGEAIWGRWGWQTRLAEEFGCRDSTVRKYKAGRLPVPRSLAAFLRERYARMTSTRSREDRSLRGRILRRGDELVIRLDDPGALAELHVTLDPQRCTVEASGLHLLVRRAPN